MKAAVIDLGTNTFHLVISTIRAGKVDVIYKTNIPVQLGQGKINEGEIIPEAFERGINALKTFRTEIDKHGVDLIKATATAAVRSASNGTDFVREAAEKAGITITVISGEQEAGYIFKGVQATGLIRQKSLIMDIGGGSTEFILCSPEGQFWKKSYPVGAARLLQAYWHSDPVSVADQQAIASLLEKELHELVQKCNFYQPQCLIGSAGAFETYAAMLLPETDLKNIAAAKLDYEAFSDLLTKLIVSNHATREAIPELIPLRVDMIVMASLLCRYILKNTGVKQIALSTYDLKMGILYQLAAEEL
ncbi:exopolyphosphatase [Pedobacter antarcticus]|uniref:Ppx/GppA phosphatase family protein n=1 Tax=Pedobacter antarcticus TaxID=34086 RepID=UPI001C5946B4|nr:exopolyphosphatase [Pedobacter antarcticus]